VIGRRAESLGLLRSRSVHHLGIYSYGKLLGKEAEVLGADDHLLAELPLLIEHARRGIFELPRAVSGTVPLPEKLATGYFYQDGVQVPQPVDYVKDYPSGSIVSTAEDMSHFMLAHLQDGCYQGSCVLQASTVAEMHQRRAKTPYEGQSVALGFVEGLQGGQRLLGHSGAISGFGSILDLLPAHDLGYLFSFNEECWQTSACEIISAFGTQLLERFFSD